MTPRRAVQLDLLDAIAPHRHTVTLVTSTRAGLIYREYVCASCGEVLGDEHVQPPADDRDTTATP